MARIAGVDLPREKRLEYGLTYIYGIGVSTSRKILAMTGIDPDKRVKDLTEDEVSKLREAIEHNVTVEGDLRRNIAMDIKGLPVRGQRSKTNARTRKGPRKTIANKKQ